MSEDPWGSATLANRFVDEAYASVKGYVRTHVLHQHLLTHLPPSPARILDVGGGAGNQSFPLAQAGYDVTILDPSPAMLGKARQRLAQLPAEAQQRVTLVKLTARTPKKRWKANNSPPCCATVCSATWRTPSHWSRSSASGPKLAASSRS